MLKWYAAFIEAWFKPVPGGYVFQSPALMGDGRNRLVNEAQKAEIINILERWELLVLFLVLLALMAVGVIVIALVAAFGILRRPGRPRGPTVARSRGRRHRGCADCLCTAMASAAPRDPAHNGGTHHVPRAERDGRRKTSGVVLGLGLVFGVL